MCQLPDALFISRTDTASHCDHDAGEADMSEDSSSRRAASCAVTGVPSPEDIHPEDVSHPAQAPAGTVKS